MKSKHLRLLQKFSIFIVSSWLSLTMFIDFIAVPTVFQNVSKREEAGNIGMKVFSLFNSFEFVFSLILLIFAIFLFKRIKTKRTKTLLFSAVILTMLTGVYKFKMTPEIIRLNQEKYSLVEGSTEYKLVEKDHQFLHNLFVKLDAAKMLILLTGLILVFRESRFFDEEEA